MTATYNELYMEARRRLRAVGVVEDQLEARELICHASGKSRSEFLRDRFLYTSDGIAREMERLLRAREEGTPTAYLLGEWEFYGLTLTVTPDTLIPRPDTETLVERAILAAKGVKESCRVLDLCTGTGCVGLAVASQVPGCRLLLGDLSEEALKVAKQNVRRTCLRAAVGTAKLNALEPPPEGIGSFDVLVSNPPYISREELPTLDHSVRDYEPLLALDGGEDGLDFYRAISGKWKCVLRKGGRLLFEVGYTQADRVSAILERNGYRDITVTEDAAGIPRVVEGRNAD